MAVATSTQSIHKLNSPSATELTASQSVGRIVAIDDDPMTLRLLAAHLGKANLSLETAESGAAGLELIDDETAVAIVDLKLPDLTGFQILSYLQEHHPTVQVIVLTGSGDVSDAVEAMRSGASQYITKPFDPSELVREMSSAGDIQSRLMQQVDQIAALDSTVFIGGETGTGKSTIARMIHQRSRRTASPFVTVNCASLPRDLIQSELFGHTKGAFTGAVSDRVGHAEVANGGTLFLDEIGDLPLELQPKLLTFLQDRTVQRLGASESVKVDVRLITATHHDLAELCRQGTFRQDLYFRLLVLNLELPALRHRTAELASIAEDILSSICDRQQIKAKTISDSAMELLLTHNWPGNIRELENVLERAVAYCSSTAIQPADLKFSNLLDETSGSQSGANAVQQGYQLAGKTLQEIERDAIIETLRLNGGNKAKSARTLGISEKSIYNKMKRLEIEL